jgi:N-ethylmaleimide reductase
MKLFEKTKLGKMELKNAVVMAPMTRSRATGNVPNELMAEYYRQRADAGLIVTEGTSPSPNGLGYARIPGLFNDAQVQGWKKVTDAVHGKGGRIFLQIMHTGRVSHPLNMAAGTKIVAPSAVKLSGQMWTDAQGLQDHPVPQEMSLTDIQTAVAEYARCAELAVQAGFDGVELHAANGYFLNTVRSTNAIGQCSKCSIRRDYG